MKRAGAGLALAALLLAAQPARAERSEDRPRTQQPASGTGVLEKRLSAAEREDEAARAALQRSLAFLATQARDSGGALPVADAGAAQRTAEGTGQRTAELVKRSQDQGKQVVEAIDKILELADHPHEPGGS